jgi:hypothetical protein
MMTISKERYTCKCGEVFEAEVVTNAPVDVTLASMRTVRCPKCGRGPKEIFMGGAFKDAPPVTEPIEVRAEWWLLRGEVGVSSRTIFSAMTGGTARVYDFPHDPDDFRRCKLLLDLIPEWRAELGKVTERFPWFKPFIERWDQFEALYAEELPTGRGMAPKLYDLMQVAREEADRIRRGR